MSTAEMIGITIGALGLIGLVIQIGLAYQANTLMQKKGKPKCFPKPHHSTHS
jgi:hypothetical protein